MAGRVYVANAFSPSMLPLSVGDEALLVIKRLSVDEFRYAIKAAVDGGGVTCAVGHPSTAKLIEELVGTSLNCSRQQITLKPLDILYVVTLSFRPPEGRVYTYDELVDLYNTGKIVFYMILYIPKPEG